MESPEYEVWIEGSDEPYTAVASFDLPEEYFDGGDRVLWVEAVLDDETLSQTAIRLRRPIQCINTQTERTPQKRRPVIIGAPLRPCKGHNHAINHRRPRDLHRLGEHIYLHGQRI
jgi:hypothetical protein